MQEQERLATDLIGRLRLKDLLFVQRIAECRSLSATAVEFNLSQPAASRWLREIEQLFRAHLFARDRMVGMTPTPLGELVLQRSRALLADVSSLSDELDAHRAGRGGYLHLGVIPYVSERLLEKLVSTLVDDHAMKVSVVEAATEPLMEALRMQRLNAVIGRCSAQPLGEGLSQEILFTQKACLLLNASAAARRPAQPRLSDFSGCRWILPPKDSPTWHAIIAATSAGKMAAPQSTVETASTKLVHALVTSNSDMVAVLPHEIGMDLERLGGVRVLPFPAQFRMPPVGLFAHTRHWDFSHLTLLRKTLRHLIATSNP